MVTEQVIKVSQETYERLDTEARARGLNIERLLEDIVQEFVASRERAFIERLRMKGLLVSTPTASPGAPRNFKPVPIDGEPLSQTIIEDRE
jgi:hypothetical protein